MKKQKSKEGSSSKTLGEEHRQADGEALQDEVSPDFNEAEEVAASSQIKKKKKENKKKVLEEKSGIAEEKNEIDATKEPNSHSNDEKKDAAKNKRKKRLLKEAEKADKRGVCYLSRIPPHMDHVKLRHILSQYGDIKRIYLAAEGDLLYFIIDTYLSNPSTECR